MKSSASEPAQARRRAAPGQEGLAARDGSTHCAASADAPARPHTSVPSSSSSSLALKCIFLNSRLLIEGQEEDAGGRSCMSSTFPKNLLTGIGWLLSSSRRALLSICSTGARPASVSGAGSACAADQPCASSLLGAAPCGGRRRASAVCVGQASLPAPQPSWAAASAAEPAGSALSPARALSGGAPGAAGTEAPSLLGAGFCNSDFTTWPLSHLNFLEVRLSAALCDEGVGHAVLADVEPAASWAEAELGAE